MVLPEEKIADIDYINTEELGDTPLDNKVVFDISCTTADGRTLIIEMQKAYQANFKNRSIAYVSSKITSQSREARENYCLRPGKPWRYNLSPVYIVAILNFTFIEMDRFNKDESECGTVLDKLTYSLKHMHTLNAPPSFLNESFFKDLYNLSKLDNFEAEEIKNYMRSLFAVSDYANTIDYAREEGEARGITKRNVQIATAMLADGVNVETICKYTGLTPEEVNALKQ